VSPLCSRNARPRKGLVGRAQWGTPPNHPRDKVHEQAWKGSSLVARCGLAWARRVSARQGWAGEKSGLFEHPAAILSSAHSVRFQRCIVHKLSFLQAC
jgi:hypothetical protein